MHPNRVFLAESQLNLLLSLCQLIFPAGRKNEDRKRKYSIILSEGAWPMSDKKNPVKVSVDIFDEEYVVKGDENRDYIEMLASYVDRRMRLIHQRNPNLSATKIAVLTALNLADELNKLQEDYDELVKKMEEEKKSRMG